MAISVPNTISDLTIRARQLGILDSIVGSKKDGSYKKEDLIIPIRQKLLNDKYGKSVPNYLVLSQNIKSPMLSKRLDELKQDFVEEVWKDDRWDLEEKIDGVRCIIIKDSSGIHFLSRDNSRYTLMPIEMPILHDIDLSKVTYDFIIDCEIESANRDTCIFMKSHGIEADSNTQAIELLLTSMNDVMARRIQMEHDFKYVFNVFDCLYYNSVWVMSETLLKRREFVSNIVEILSGCSSSIVFRSVYHSNIDKKKFFDRCIASGYEGCIAKRLDSCYIPDTTRSMKGWIKIKKPKKFKSPVLADMSELESIGISPKSNMTSSYNNRAAIDLGVCDTVDAFISGFTIGDKGSLTENMVEYIEASVWVLDKSTNEYKLKSLGKIEYMDYIVRDQITDNVGGIATLKPSSYNAVVELDPLCSTVIRLRYDKNSSDCIMDEITYNQVMNGK